jgi:integrase
MARPATGSVIPPKGKQRSWALRFTAYGKRRQISLGRPDEGWNRQRAEAELENVLADVRRGIWQPHTPEPVEAPAGAQTFHEFASAWYERHRPEWRENTAGDYLWSLSHHLLPFFKDHALAQITAEEVDRYKTAKLREGKLSPNTINKTLTRLAQILAEAVEYGHLERNPGIGRRRRLKAEKPKHRQVEPEQLPALLEAADGWLRPVVATLMGAGLRVGEAVALKWRDVNLATGTLTVQDSKTHAGTGRTIDLPGGLVDELTEWRTRSPLTAPEDPAFVCRAYNGEHGTQTKDNIGRRLKVAIRDANEALGELGIEQISEKVSPHDLRRSYAPLRLAAGDDPFRVSEQLGHASSKITYSVYHRAVKRRAKLSGVYAEQHDRALDWAHIGRIGVGGLVNLADARTAKRSQTAPASEKLNHPGA